MQENKQKILENQEKEEAILNQEDLGLLQSDLCKGIRKYSKRGYNGPQANSDRIKSELEKISSNNEEEIYQAECLTTSEGEVLEQFSINGYKEQYYKCEDN